MTTFGFTRGVHSGSPLLLASLTAGLLSCTRAVQPQVPPPEARAHAGTPASTLPDSLLQLMTLDEKLGQLTMAPAQWNQTGPGAAAGGEQQVREGKLGSFLSFWGAAATRRMQRLAVEESRLGIPLLFAQD
ncbi:MAG: hypothetical protein ABI785_11170, partial [Gemmatimonadales bacterium]